MSILNHFVHLTLSPDQVNAVSGIEDFVNGDGKVFILKGYAGTGKTTILKGIIDYLNAQKKAVEVMAPTGRAAKILRDKTGRGQTIHKSIYNFKELKTIEDEKDDADSSFHYYFPIHHIENNETVLIIDEASMISSRHSSHELFTFGTGILLNDLLTYSRIPTSRCKLIVVGDPAQLPPVGDNQSLALSEEYFRNLGFKTFSATLTTVKRQDQNSILINAFRIRSLIGNPEKSSLEFEFDNQNSFEIRTDHIPCQYLKEFPVPEIGNGVIIAFSNSQCHQYNVAVRNKLYPELPTVQAGDVLLINHNNYHTYGVEMMNGDMAKALEVSPSAIERKNIPVYDVIAGKRVKKHITLTFREVTIRLGNHPEDIKCLIVDSLLNSPNRDLHILELKALYVDFVMRYKEEQERNKAQGKPVNKVGSPEFKDRLRTDRCFNAVRVKYGYAITCHKAQGGEWDTVFVDYFGRNSLSDDPLRWSYTATTRARLKFYAGNAPMMAVFTKFKINAIGVLTQVPTNALSLAMVPLSPFHQAQQHRAKSLKFWELQEKLEPTAFQITQVLSLGDFRERYSFQFQDEVIQMDADHNVAGIFNDFHVAFNPAADWKEELLHVVNQSYPMVYNIEYEPSSEGLKKLWGIMQMAAEESGVTITNVEEKTQQYFVNYFLKTDTKAAMIQFYYNGKGQLTSGLPKSNAGANDVKLSQLIQKLQQYAV